MSLRVVRSLLLSCAVAAAASIAMCAFGQEPAAGDSGVGKPAITEQQRRELERIGTLGYTVGGDRAPEKRGVTVREEESYAGYTVFVSADFPGAYLIDMDGSVLHIWQETRPRNWTRAWVYPDGSTLGISAYPGRLVKLDRDSNQIWEYGTEEDRAHHDVTVGRDGTIYVLMRTAKVIEWLALAPVLEDAVCILRSEADSVREVSCLSIPDAFYESDYASWVASPRFGKGSKDPFHTNTVEVLDGTAPHPEFREGNILVTVRNMNCLAVIDTSNGSVVWANKGRWQQQHEARVIPNGHLMLFDNRKFEGQSRVVEYDVVADEVVWSYTEEGFFSRGTGAQQLLPNDNILITESQKGRIFEITRDGRVVWEYWNPRRAVGGENIVRITRAFRVPYDYFEGDFAACLAEGGEARHLRASPADQ